jgi:hypothetical protein
MHTMASLYCTYVGLVLSTVIAYTVLDSNVYFILEKVGI